MGHCVPNPIRLAVTLALLSDALCPRGPRCPLRTCLHATHLPVSFADHALCPAGCVPQVPPLQRPAGGPDCLPIFRAQTCSGGHSSQRARAHLPQPLSYMLHFSTTAVPSTNQVRSCFSTLHLHCRRPLWPLSFLAESWWLSPRCSPISRPAAHPRPTRPHGAGASTIWWPPLKASCTALRAPGLRGPRGEAT